MTIAILFIAIVTVACCVNFFARASFTALYPKHLIRNLSVVGFLWFAPKAHKGGVEAFKLVVVVVDGSLVTVTTCSHHCPMNSLFPEGHCTLF